MADHLDLDGHGANLDPVDDWRLLDDEALTAALTARGVTDGVLDRLLIERDEPFAGRLLDRFLGIE